MVRVTIKGEKFDRIEFDFADCEVAGKFLNVAMEAAVQKVTAEIKTVEPAAEQQESRFIAPEEIPQEETVSVEEFF